MKYIFKIINLSKINKNHKKLYVYMTRHKITYVSYYSMLLKFLLLNSLEFYAELLTTDYIFYINFSLKLSLKDGNN